MLDKLATKSSSNTKRGISTNLLNKGQSLQKPLKALANLKKSAASNLSNLDGTTVTGTAHVATHMKQYRNTQQALGHHIHTASQEDDRQGITSTASMFTTKIIKTIMEGKPSVSHRRPITANPSSGAGNLIAKARLQEVTS